MFLFSFVNPEHERRAAEIIREEFPDVEHISLSHEVMAAWPRVRAGLHHARQRVRRAADRVATSSHLQEKLRTAGYAGQLLIMQATGGVMPPGLRRPARGDAARERPDRRRHGSCRSPRSGPASTTSSRSTWAARASTSAWCAAAGPRSRPTGTGATATTSASRWWTCRASAPAAGRSPGCARARCSSARRARAPRPGPPATARGGDRPTVTDADAVLGYLPVDGFAGGRMTLDVDAARAAIEARGQRPAGHRRRRGRVGHRAHREREHGERDPPGPRRPRGRPPPARR